MTGSAAAIPGPAPAPNEDPDHFFICLDCGAVVGMSCPGADEDGTDGNSPDFRLPGDVLGDLHQVAALLEVENVAALRLLLSCGLEAVGRGNGRWAQRTRRLREHLVFASTGKYPDEEASA